MKKFVVVMVALVATAAFVAPAFADVTVKGYLRTIMQADNVDGNGAKDAPTASEIDQRLRALITNQINENVKVVYYGEVDTKWGQATGGQLGADGVQLQTKNVYMDFNVPDTMANFRVGVQGFNPGFDGFLLNHDAAGLIANLKASDNFKLALQYSKFDEGSNTAADDVDWYAAIASLKLAGDSKLSLMAAYVDDNQSFYDEDAAGKDNYQYLGAEFNGKAGDIGINAWVLYNMGTTNEDDVTEGDISGYAATVQAVFGPAAVRALYVSGDDGTNGFDSDAFNYDLGGAFYLYKENLQIFFTDVYYMNLGSTNLDKLGNGLMALTAKYDTNIGDYYLKLGAGYFESAEDNAAGDADMGYEVAGRFGRKLADTVDVSLNAAYVGIGDAIDPNGDDIYKVNFMLNLPF